MMPSEAQQVPSDPDVAKGASVSVSPRWREYFLQNLRQEPRFPSGRRFLRQHINDVLRGLIPEDARVLELGVGGGHLLASLPNRVRDGMISCQRPWSQPRVVTQRCVSGSLTR